MVIIFPFTFDILASSSFSGIPFGIWMSVLFVVFITTAFAFYLINYSLKTVSPNLNGIYIYLQPLIAAVFAIISGKDRLTVIDLIAAVLIMAGVYLITKQKSEERSRIP
jgi:drug/metabolite transporter (DMT)-like permease